MALARAVSKSSRRMALTEDPSESDETRALRAFAMRTLRSGEVDIVVCAHSHHPVIEEYPTPDGTGLYVNTGDWMIHKSHVEWDGAAFHLHHSQGSATGTSTEPVKCHGAVNAGDNPMV